MASHSSSLPILDHIVVLVSQSTLLAAPALLKEHLVVTPGGEHAGGLTSNKLILFQDGVYIEMIAFHEDIDPEARRNHRWGKCKENTIVDWAYTLPCEEDFRAVQQRVRDADAAGIEYAEPVPGGRTRPDGTVLKWVIGAAQDAHGRGVRPGRLPFWCLDQTPRHLRVPYEMNPGATEHPSCVSGVSRLRLSELRDEIDTSGRVLDAIHQVSRPERVWGFDVPAETSSSSSSSPPPPPTTTTTTTATSAEPRHSVAMSAASGEDGPEIRLVLSGNGSSPASIELAAGLVVEVETK